MEIHLAHGSTRFPKHYPVPLVKPDSPTASTTLWEPLSSEDLDVPIDPAILVPDTPPRDEEPFNEDDGGSYRLRRRQGEYHHRPPVWHIEFLDAQSPESPDAAAYGFSQSGEGTNGVASWDTSFKSKRNAHFTKDVPQGLDSTWQSQKLYGIQGNASQVVAVTTTAEANISSATSDEVDTTQQLPSPLISTCFRQGARTTHCSRFHDIRCHVEFGEMSQFIPGSRVVYVGDTVFPDSQKHQFGAIWVVYALFNDLWAHCIRLEPDSSKEFCGFPSKLLTVLPLNQHVRMFSAIIPLAALTVERNLAGYLARRGLQSPDGLPTSPAYGQCVYPPEKAHKSVSIPATDRLKGKVLMSLIIDASFRDQRHHSTRLSAQDGDSQQQSAGPLHSRYVDAMTYFLETPDFKISDAVGKERLAVQTTRDTDAPIGRRGSMKRIRRKMRSLFHSQANDADPIL